jgi:hypothetical protein
MDDRARSTAATAFTNVPAPTRLVTNPSAPSRSYATLTVVRETAGRADSSLLGGKASPGPRLPERMAAWIWP